MKFPAGPTREFQSSAMHADYGAHFTPPGSNHPLKRDSNFHSHWHKYSAGGVGVQNPPPSQMQQRYNGLSQRSTTCTLPFTAEGHFT